MPVLPPTAPATRGCPCLPDSRCAARSHGQTPQREARRENGGGSPAHPPRHGAHLRAEGAAKLAQAARPKRCPRRRQGPRRCLGPCRLQGTARVQTGSRGLGRLFLPSPGGGPLHGLKGFPAHHGVCSQAIGAVSAAYRAHAAQAAALRLDHVRAAVAVSTAAAHGYSPFARFSPPDCTRLAGRCQPPFSKGRADGPARSLRQGNATHRLHKFVSLVLVKHI